jgi:hypothetical protein
MGEDAILLAVAAASPRTTNADGKYVRLTAAANPDQAT